jgi:hypothetical protein
LGSQGDSVLMVVARAMRAQLSHTAAWGLWRVLSRHVLWQQKQLQQQQGLVDLVLQVLQPACRILTRTMAVFALVDEVLGADAATMLWQQLVERHSASVALRQQGPQVKGIQPGACLGVDWMQYMWEGLSRAGHDLSEQRRCFLQPLQEAIRHSTKQQSMAGSTPAGSTPLPAATGFTGPSTGGVPQSRHVAIQQITTAARLGQCAELQQLLQTMPAVAQKVAYVEAAQAAAMAGHHQLAAQLLYTKVVRWSSRPTYAVGTRFSVNRVVSSLEDIACCEDVDDTPLGPRSLALCGSLWSAWQEVRRQQQQELVDGVVEAVTAWHQGRQQVHDHASSKRRHVAGPAPALEQGAAPPDSAVSSAAAQQHGPDNAPSHTAAAGQADAVVGAHAGSSTAGYAGGGTIRQRLRSSCRQRTVQGSE